MKKRILVSAIASLLIVGCGGGSGATGSKDINGKVVDGYVKDAKVYADVNDNGKWDTTEPWCNTDVNGSYKLTVSNDLNNSCVIISEGGVDVDTDANVTVNFKSTINKPIVTPATTLVVDLMKKYNIPEDEATAKVATALDINKTDIAKDPIECLKEGNNKPYKANIALHHSAEMIADAKYGGNTTKTYENFAESIAKHENIKSVSKIIYYCDANVTVKEDTKVYIIDPVEDENITFNNKADIAKEIYSNVQNAHDTAVDNAKNAHDIAVENAKNAHDTAVENAKDAFNTAVENAKNAHNTAKGNVTSAHNTAVENAKNAHDTAVDNAKNAHDTAVDNAKNAHDTAKGNATSAHDTAVDNAKNAHDTAVENAKNAHDTAKTNAKNAHDTAKDNAKNSHNIKHL